MRPPLSRTFAINLGTAAVFGAIATTCAKFELERRRFEHEKATSLLLEEARQQAMELERQKFKHEKERLELEGEKVRIRKTTLTDSARQKAEHQVLRISRSGVTHLDASDFVQKMWEEFLSTETIATDSSRQ